MDLQKIKKSHLSLEKQLKQQLCISIKMLLMEVRIKNKNIQILIKHKINRKRLLIYLKNN